MNMNKVEAVIAAIGTGQPLDCDHWRKLAFRYAHKTRTNSRVSDEYRARARTAALAIWEHYGPQRDAAYKI